MRRRRGRARSARWRGLQPPRAGRARAVRRPARAARSARAPPARARVRARDRSAGITSNDGFSVVAPSSTTVPRSTCGRSASCCALLKRWISSMNSAVRRPRRRSSWARAISSRKSFTPESTALIAAKRRPARSARRRASVVLPEPGGPQKMHEGSFAPLASTGPSGPLGPSRCAWPANSSRLRGRIRSASGASAATSRVIGGSRGNSSTAPS